MKTKKLGICESMIPSALFISAVYPVYSIPTILYLILYPYYDLILLLPCLSISINGVYDLNRVYWTEKSLQKSIWQ
jgi:hypothetical protein